MGGFIHPKTHWELEGELGSRSFSYQNTQQSHRLSFLCTQQHSRESPTPSEKGSPEENEFEVYNFLLH